MRDDEDDADVGEEERNDTLSSDYVEVAKWLMT